MVQALDYNASLIPSVDLCRGRPLIDRWPASLRGRLDRGNGINVVVY